MAKEKRREPLENRSLLPSRGIPSFDPAEKLTEIIPVKVQPSLKKAIPKPQSAWIREAIIEKLQRLEEEESFE